MTQQDNNDPWRGRGNGGDGQPDLGKILNDLQRKLNRWANGGKGQGSQDGGSSGSVNVFFGVLVAIVVLVLWALSGLYIVSPAQQAVVLRFGQYQTTQGPGIHWLPRFIESAYKVNTQKVSTFTYTGEMLTKGENIVSVELAVQYRVSNPKNYLFNIVDPDESLRQATASALRQVIGASTLDNILTTARTQIRNRVEKQLRTTLKLYNPGIAVMDVNMQPAKPPEQVASAFEDVIRASEDETRYQNQAQAYASRVVPISEGQAKRTIAEAKAYAQQVVLAAQADVASYNAVLSVYTKAPSVTRERLYLDTISSILEKSSKVLVDVKGSNNLLYLPIDKLIKADTRQVLPKVTTKKALTDIESTASDAPPPMRNYGRSSREVSLKNSAGIEGGLS